MPNSAKGIDERTLVADMRLVAKSVLRIILEIKTIDRIILSRYRNYIGYSWGIIKANFYTMLGVYGYGDRNSFAGSVEYLIQEIEPDWEFESWAAIQKEIRR